MMVETIRTPVFDRYRVQEKVGSGGMGTVYQARDMHLDRWVALKVLPPGTYEDEESIERFKREARALARLKHPGVAAVYDAHVECGFPYLVMEFVEGKNLEQVLVERGPLDVEEVVRLGTDLAEALDHIHRHRIVHRDLKTANIIIRPSGQAVVADFGIAFVASLPRISQGAIGTPEYMSPEQAEGRPLDGRSDLYSLGVVLFECLTGKVPFQREGESLAALTALMRQVQEAPVPSLQERRPDAPEWLCAVVAQCTAKRPEDRYATGSELALALRTAGTGYRQASLFGPASLESAALPHTAPGPEADAAAPATGLDPGRETVLISHLSPVEVVAFSPDGRRLVTACKDRRIRVWEVTTARLLNTLEGHEGNVLSVSFNSNGCYLASGDEVGGVCIWETTTGRLLRRLDAHIALVMSVAFSPDGRLLATGGADGAVRIWDVRKGHMVSTPGWHAGYVLSVAYSPDGRRIASGGADGAVHLWDPEAGRLLLTIEGHPGRVTSVSYSEDGRLLATGGADGDVHLWSARTGELIHSLRGHTDWVLGVAFRPGSKELASAGRDGTIRLWRIDSGKPLCRVGAHGSPVLAVGFSPDGRQLASGSSDHTVRLWRLRSKGLRSRVWLRRAAGWALLAALAGASLWGDVDPDAPYASAPMRAGSSAIYLEEPARPEPVQANEMLFSSEGLQPHRGGWTLIVAVKPDRREAEQVAAFYRRQGYRTGVLDRVSEGAVRYRFGVGIGQFARQADAASVRRRLAGLIFPTDTWMLRIRRGRSY